jgi:nucleotide-binding universal stress UspA family protein
LVFKRILLAVDGSASSARAKEAAAALPNGSESEILVLHIREVEVTRGEHATEDSDHAVSLVNEVVADLQARGLAVTGEARSATSGHVAPAIIAAANEFGADLIVMGTRGLSDFAALLVGSVAHKVINHADCAVLVTR